MSHDEERKINDSLINSESSNPSRSDFRENPVQKAEKSEVEVGVGGNGSGSGGGSRSPNLQLQQQRIQINHIKNFESQSQRDTRSKLSPGGGNVSQRLQNAKTFLGGNRANEECSTNAKSNGEKLCVSQNKILNYGSMGRNRRSEHRNSNFERRLSYGYDSQNVRDVRTTTNPAFNKNFMMQTGSLERDGNYKMMTMMNNSPYDCSSLKRESMRNMVDYRQNPTNGRMNVSTNKSNNHHPSHHQISNSSPSKNSSTGKNVAVPTEKSNEENATSKDYRYFPSRTESTNRTSYYSHVSRLERSGNDECDGRTTANANVKRYSYDFDKSSSVKSDRHVNCVGYKTESPEKSTGIVEYGKDRQRFLPQHPPPGGPPPFYNPPQPPGKLL